MLIVSERLTNMVEGLTLAQAVRSSGEEREKVIN